MFSVNIDAPKHNLNIRVVQMHGAYVFRSQRSKLLAKFVFNRTSRLDTRVVTARLPHQLSIDQVRPVLPVYAKAVHRRS